MCLCFACVYVGVCVLWCVCVCVVCEVRFVCVWVVSGYVVLCAGVCVCLCVCLCGVGGCVGVLYL